jgi:hypothetical protein
LAFFRFTRDKRGYQHFSLVEPIANRRGKVRQRVLYWFRSPPDIKVGREPFDEGIRRALEAQHPDVTFDWRAILEAPIPSADADKWRERRRAERAAKQALASADSEQESAEPEEAERSSEERDAADSRGMESGRPSAAAAGEAGRRKRRRRGRRPLADAQVVDSTEPGPRPAADESPETGDSSDE